MSWWMAMVQSALYVTHKLDEHENRVAAALRRTNAQMDVERLPLPASAPTTTSASTPLPETTAPSFTPSSPMSTSLTSAPTSMASPAPSPQPLPLTSEPARVCIFAGEPVLKPVATPDPKPTPLRAPSTKPAEILPFFSRDAQSKTATTRQASYSPPVPKHYQQEQQQQQYIMILMQQQQQQELQLQQLLQAQVHVHRAKKAITKKCNAPRRTFAFLRASISIRRCLGQQQRIKMAAIKLSQWTKMAKKHGKRHKLVPRILAPKWHLPNALKSELEQADCLVAHSFVVWHKNQDDEPMQGPVPPPQQQALAVHQENVP
ncbi:hypothetical protein BC940DRAFT_360387 [Gongronella butleri]|nr:hypothetical protein BC940DRAFT_360387 [Gongronella butleri]